MAEAEKVKLLTEVVGELRIANSNQATHTDAMRVHFNTKQIR